MARRTSSSKHGILWWIFVICFAWPFMAFYYGLKWIFQKPKRGLVALAVCVVCIVLALAFAPGQDAPSVVAASTIGSSPAPTAELARAVQSDPADDQAAPDDTTELLLVEEPEETPAPTVEPTPDPTPEPTPVPAVTHSYVLNTNTKKFHYPNCSSVSDMKALNRWDFEGTREDVIAMGYEPCGRCHP